MDLKFLLGVPPWDWPRDTAKVFHKILTNERADPSNRLIAAELAGDMVVINDELADDLLRVMGSADEPAEMRSRAAISLGPVLEQGDTMGFEDPGDVPITEDTFHQIQESLHEVYLEDQAPKEVRRRVLEASVRAPEDWQSEAVSAAYSSGDREWVLTAVFAMQFLQGFDDQILEALHHPDPEIHYEAVRAAGEAELEGAWSHIVDLTKRRSTPKDLLIVAIGAAASIRPSEARNTLGHLTDSDDVDIAEAAEEAIGMAESMSGEFGDDEDSEEDAAEWIN